MLNFIHSFSTTLNLTITAPASAPQNGFKGVKYKMNA
jgi:hypothetical protein